MRAAPALFLALICCLCVYIANGIVPELPDGLWRPRASVWLGEATIVTPVYTPLGRSGGPVRHNTAAYESKDRRSKEAGSAVMHCAPRADKRHLDTIRCGCAPLAFSAYPVHTIACI